MIEIILDFLDDVLDYVGDAVMRRITELKELLASIRANRSFS